MADLEAAIVDNRSSGDGVKSAVSFSAFKPQVVLPVSKAEEAVQFYKSAFGAEELKRTSQPKRKAEQELPLIICAELKIGSSSILVCDQTDDSIPAIDGTGGGIIFILETDDVAGAVAKAVEAGAAADGEILDAEGTCGVGLLVKVKDPFGVIWAIASVGKKDDESEAEAEAEAAAEAED